MHKDRASRRRVEKSLRKIKIVPTNFKLTAATGLGMVVAGHIHGVSALSDLAQIKEDPY